MNTQLFKSNIEEEELELCWSLPEPRSNLFFYEHMITRVATGDSRDRLENYLGKLRQEDRLWIYDKLAQGKMPSAELEFVLQGIDLKAIKAQCEKLIRINERVKEKTSFTKRTIRRIQKMVLEIIEGDDVYVPAKYSEREFEYRAF